MENTAAIKESAVIKSRTVATVEFLGFSLFGIFMFFINIEIKGTSTIPIQHIINFLNATFAAVIPYFALAMVIFGAVSPVIKGVWKRSAFDFVFTAAKIIGVPIGFMGVFEIGPALLLQPDYIPFLWKSIVLPIAVMIPVSGIAFAALMNFGLVEFVGKFMSKIMYRIWKTPGESAVDAIVSFSGGYALACLVTNDFYKRGVYTGRESVIIATGFSTVAISFLIVIANTLGFMERWNLYFWSCVVVTFAVTAITARIYPISKIPDTYYDKPAERVPDSAEPLFAAAWKQGVDAAQKSPSYFTHLKNYYLGEALKMSSAVTASILSIGLLGLLIAELTPLFDWIGYLFYPFTLLARLPEPMLAAKAVGMEIAEMFLPALAVTSASEITRFVIAVTSVSAVLFFSASIPCLISTEIPIKLKDILLIWIERTIFSLLIAAAIGHILL